MSDDIYETPDEPLDYSDMDLSGMANQDTVYSNPVAQAGHLLEEFGEETAREHFRENDVPEERIDELLAEASDGNIGKADPTLGWDAALLDAIQKSSRWEATEYRDGADLSQAPGIWQNDQHVPDSLLETIAQIIEEVNWGWETLETLPADQADRLEEIIDEQLTQPQGWSLESIAEELQREFFLQEDAAVVIAAETTHEVLNTAREASSRED